MASAFLDDAARKAFGEAVTAIEAGSSVEVVIAVRTRARRWLHAYLIAGMVAAWASLAFMLYADHPFALASFLIDPLLAGVVVGLASTLFPPFERLVTPRGLRRRAVLEAARATFYERGVHHTTGRTGVLVYIALGEQMAELVADDAVRRAADPERWAVAAAAVDSAIRLGGVATARTLQAITSLCAYTLPHRDDDINELPDAIDEGEATA